MTPRVMVASELDEILFPSSCKNRSLAVVGGYFDESHDDRKSRFFVIAGWIANTWDWLELDKRWDACLAKHGLPYFHSADCESGIEVFAKFRDNPDDDQARLKPHEKEKLKEIKTEFVDTCLDRKVTIAGLGVVVFVEDFNSLISGDERANRLFQGDPYFLCFQAVMTEAGLTLAAENHRKGTRDILAFMFDQQDEISNRAKPLYDDFQKKNPDASEYLGALGFASKVQYRRLQAADMLAYEVFKFVRNKANYPDKKRVAWERLAPNVARIYRFDRQSLQMVLDHQRDGKSVGEVVSENMSPEHKITISFDSDIQEEP